MNESRFLDNNYLKRTLERIREETKKYPIVKGSTLRALDIVEETTYSDVFGLDNIQKKKEIFNITNPSTCLKRGAFRAIRFAKAIAHKIRGVDFALRDARSSQFTFWVFMEEKVYTMGYIGYGDFATTVSPIEHEYMVCGFPIRNDKYDMYSEQHYMARSIHMDKALKKASAYLRNPTPQDVAILNAFKAKREFTDLSDKMYHEERGAVNAVCSDEGMLLRELKHLVAHEHKFINDVFASNVQRWLYQHEQLEERKRKKLHLYHVRVYNVDDVQTFDVITMQDVQGNVHDSIKELKTYTIDDVPEHIVGKVSVLSMVNPKTFVDDVGYRDDAGCFYITQ